MKDKFTFLLILVSITVFSFGLFKRIPPALAHPYYEVHYFNTDKETYFNDQTINITASWELFYDEEIEIAAFKVRIYNITNDVIWETQWYPEKGLKEEEWIVRIHDLDSSFENSTTYLFVELYYYDQVFPSQSGLERPVAEKTIKTLKRNITCELLNFKSHVTSEEFVELNAHFSYYNDTFDSYDNLSFFIVVFDVYRVDEMLFSENFITNSKGRVKINLTDHLKLETGIYQLKFRCQNNNFFDTINLTTFCLYVNSNELFSSSEDQANTTVKEKFKDFATISSVIVISAVALGLVSLLIMKKRNEKNIANLSFRY